MDFPLNQHKWINEGMIFTAGTVLQTNLKYGKTREICRHFNSSSETDMMQYMVGGGGGGGGATYVLKVSVLNISAADVIGELQ